MVWTKCTISTQALTTPKLISNVGFNYCYLFLLLGNNMGADNQAPSIVVVRGQSWQDRNEMGMTMGTRQSRAARSGGVSNGGVSRSGIVLPFFVLLGYFSDFSGCLRFWGFFCFVLFLFLGFFLKHLRGTVPKGSATQSGPFPKRMGNPPVWNPPGLASPKASWNQPSKNVRSGKTSTHDLIPVQCQRTPGEGSPKQVELQCDVRIAENHLWGAMHFHCDLCSRCRKSLRGRPPRCTLEPFGGTLASH